MSKPVPAMRIPARLCGSDRGRRQRGPGLGLKWDESAVSKYVV